MGLFSAPLVFEPPGGVPTATETAIARRQPRSADPPPGRLEEPRLLRRGKAFAEMERVFDICHGCRRCVSLCQSVSRTAVRPGRRHRRRRGARRGQGADYWKVVDQCYLCDLCYMTKVPYVPPHAWNLDFPHLMLRAKAISSGRARSRRRRCWPPTDGARPVRRHPDRRAGGQRVNATKAMRGVMDSSSACTPTPGCPRWRRSVPLGRAMNQRRSR